MEAWIRPLAGPVTSLRRRLWQAEDSVREYFAADWNRTSVLPETDDSCLTRPKAYRYYLLTAVVVVFRGRCPRPLPGWLTRAVFCGGNVAGLLEGEDCCAFPVLILSIYVLSVTDLPPSL